MPTWRPGNQWNTRPLPTGVDSGAVELNGLLLEAGDGAAARDEDLLRRNALKDAEVVLVDAARGLDQEAKSR